MEELIAKYRTIALNNLDSIDVEIFQKSVSIIRRAIEQNKAIYLMGNGGSASTANHFVNDLINIRNRTQSHSIISSLSSNNAVITCIGNDFGFDYIFSKQLDNILTQGDLVIAFSVSGNSRNILNTLPIIKNNNAMLISFTGFDGGHLAQESDINFHIQAPISEKMFGPPEGLHLYYGHLLMDLIQFQINDSV